MNNTEEKKQRNRSLNFFLNDEIADNRVFGTSDISTADANKHYIILQNDTLHKKIYELARMLRSHGMVRESGNRKFEKSMIKKFSNLSPKFIFLYPSYNLRNNEISAVFGLNQLKRLDKNNRIRNKNLKFFLQNIKRNFYWTDFDLVGCSNYAFPLVLKNKNFNNRKKLEQTLKDNNIEFRRGNAGGGNQLRQPYLKKYVKNLNLNTFKNVDHVHFFGYYIGNYPSLKIKKIKKICKILNNIDYE